MPNARSSQRRCVWSDRKEHTEATTHSAGVIGHQRKDGDEDDEDRIQSARALVVWG